MKESTPNTRKKDKYIKDGFLALIEINWNHNHLIETADALSHHHMSAKTKARVRDLFSQNLTVPQVAAVLREEIELECEECDDAANLEKKVL